MKETNNKINVKDINFSDEKQRTNFVNYIIENIDVFLGGYSVQEQKYIMSIGNLDDRYEILKGIAPKIFISCLIKNDKNISKERENFYVTNDLEDLNESVKNLILKELFESLADIQSKSFDGKNRKCIKFTNNLAKIVNLSRYKEIEDIIQHCFKSFILYNKIVRNTNVTEIDASHKNLERLPDLSLFGHLDLLDCSNNNLKELILNDNLYVDELNCTNNQKNMCIETKNALIIDHDNPAVINGVISTDECDNNCIENPNSNVILSEIPAPNKYSNKNDKSHLESLQTNRDNKNSKDNNNKSL